jgi:O-antigen chain-terminating methyltransferase
MKLNVENVMSQVRDEVFRRGGTFGSANADESVDTSGAFPHWKPATAPVKIKPAYELSELLLHSDRAFVEGAYLAVLRRLPDASGMATYLSQLRSGEMTKVEVLAALRWSPEGLARGIHVNGLLAPYLLQKWQRRRVIGPVLRWATGLLRVSDFADRAKKIEAVQAAEIQDLGRLVNALTRQVQARLMRIEEQGHDWSEESRLSGHEIGAQLEQLRVQVSGLDARLSAEIDGLRKQLAEHAAQIPKLNPQNNHELDPLYVAFEEAFRGSSELIRERALPYVDIVRSAGAGTDDAPVIDLGCGRGDWLEILREHGLVAVGVDSNRMFLGMCAVRGLNVVEGDVLEVLSSMPDGSAGAITGMHIAEHLPFEVLIRMLDECRRVLRVGGVLALETPNPENAWVGSHLFYMDPTHRNPLPPLALRWLVEARGFADARIERWTIARDIGAPPLLAPEVPGATSLNVLLTQIHNAPDYAIIARRPQ